MKKYNHPDCWAGWTRYFPAWFILILFLPLFFVYALVGIPIGIGGAVRAWYDDLSEIWGEV